MSRDRPPADNPLLEKAAEHKPKQGPKERTYTDNEVDLIIRWLHGEYQTSQVSHALELKQSGHLYGLAARALKQYADKGRITIVWRAKG